MAAKEPIHSGHFMTSNPHEVKPDEDDEDFEVDVVDVDDSMTDIAQEKVARQDKELLKDEKPVTFYKFGPEKTQSIAIDVSLNKLKKCINVAYMKLTTPKWKDFKGLKMQWKHRIRLNNVIWRAYYMEFRKPDKKKKTPYCYFAVPDDDTTHTKIEGSVLEGMYWKRRMEAVCAQYKRWRTYNRPAKKKSKACCRKRENSCTCIPSRPPQSQTPNMTSYNDLFDVDEFDNEFTNSLFESLNVPFLFPNPKEIGPDSVGNADIMQPCLLSLQPSIDEINLVNGVDMNHADSHIILPEVVPANLQIPPYRPKEYKEYKEYDNGSMSMEYRNQQPTRQSSAVSQNVLMSTQMSQPLYSRAIYDSVAQLHHSSPQSFGNEDSSGRASSTISFGTSTPQPQTYMSPHIIAAVSGSTVIQPSPSPVFANSQTSSPFSNHDSNVFRNKFIMENNLHHQQQQHQFWINSVQQQHYLQNEQNRRAIQMLQSQAPHQSPLGISPTMGMSNGNMQFGSTLLNLSNANTASSSTLTNLIQRNNIMSNQQMHFMHNNNSPLSRYLAPNNSDIHQQQQQLQQTTLPSPQQQISSSNQISGILQTKPNETRLEYPYHNGFAQIKMEKPFIKQQAETDSEISDDIYRSITNPASAEPSGSTFSQLTPSFQSLRTESQPSAQIFKSASTGDTPANSAPPTTQYSQRYNGRAQKRVASNISTRSSPNYTQVASTSSSDAILSDSETNEKSDDIPKRKRRATSSRTEQIDDSLHPEERKRILHLNAEKNRRNALKDGFDMLTTVIPAIEEAGIKPTNAVVLNRAAQYIRSLRTESERRKEDLVTFKERIEKMNAKIAMLQSNLPSTCRSQSSSVANANMKNQIEQSFDRHVRNQSRLNYRYWLMAHTMRPLIQSYAKSVHTDSSDKQKVIASAQKWLNENWNVASLRPLASQMLIYLATEGNLLKNSSALPEHVMKEINKIT
uniref:BHLH domain-containing protein n=1 Tax=Panagrolaimus superbus TaxID=310955 RepID=A0A914Y9X2_9BILA